MKKLVIFIDDSPTALTSTKIATGSMNIDIKQYTSALSALEDISSGRVSPDMIICDLYMPVMDGFGFLQELRKLSLFKSTPVMMLTTEAREEVKQRGKELGLTGWIVKPFTATQIKSVISRVLRIDL